MGHGYTFNGICKGMTKAGTPCKHRVVFANGFCNQHGGDSTEFMRERLRKLVAKSRARVERFRRQMRRLQG